MDEWMIGLLTSSFTVSLTQLLIHLFTHSLESLTHSLTHSINQKGNQNQSINQSTNQINQPIKSISQTKSINQLINQPINCNTLSEIPMYRTLHFCALCTPLSDLARCSTHTDCLGIDRLDSKARRTGLSSKTATPTSHVYNSRLARIHKQHRLPN